MNVRNLLMSGVLVAMLGIAACNENPIDPPAGTTGPKNLKASSLNATSVQLDWDDVSGATGYTVSWSAAGPAGAGSVTSSTSNAVASPLIAGAVYTFSVRATGGTDSTVATIVWAGANRFDNVGGGTAKIRMYEFNSVEESGVSLFTGTGPMNVSLKAGTPGIAQLAMFVYPKAGPNGRVDSLIIGPVYAMTEYRVSAGDVFSKIDSSVYISKTTTSVPSLDSWYLSGSLATMIDAGSNVKAYSFLSGAQAQSQGFIVRHGNGNNVHFARVLVKSQGGQMLQGTYPNRYVELEISYQMQPNVPYAKRAPLTVGVYATGGH